MNTYLLVFISSRCFVYEIMITYHIKDEIFVKNKLDTEEKKKHDEEKKKEEEKKKQEHLELKKKQEEEKKKKIWRI